MSMDLLPKSGEIYSISFPRMLQQRQAFASPSVLRVKVSTTSTPHPRHCRGARSHWVQPLVELRIERHGMNWWLWIPLDFNHFRAINVPVIFPPILPAAFCISNFRWTCGNREAGRGLECVQPTVQMKFDRIHPQLCPSMSRPIC